MWRFISLRGHKEGFKTWEDYATFLLGPISHGKIHEMVKAHMLTEGENPIAKKDVDKMGVKNAAEVARLEPKERTPDIVEAAKTQSTAVVKQKVQEKINLSLPEEERKEATIFFGRNLTPRVVELVERIETLSCYMEGIRDGNKSVPLRDKVWLAVWLNFEANFQPELKEAARVMKAEEAKRHAASAQTDQEIPDPATEMDVPSRPTRKLETQVVH